MKKYSKDESDKKPASWYLELEESRVQSHEFKEPGNEYQNKSKSLEHQPVISTNIRINSMNNTMEWLEGTLLRRRSETRYYKYNTSLLEAITDGDTAYMNRMLAMGANANATCRLNQVSACHIAATINNDSLSLLINAGAISLRSDKFGRTPLHLAAWAGHVKHIANLLDFPVALQEKILKKMTPEVLQEIRVSRLTVPEMINRPCELNSLSTIPDAWSDGMEHNCRSVKESLPLFQPGWTALHAACARAQYQCVQLLLAAGADPMKTDVLSRTPIDVVGYDHYLLKHKIDPEDLKKTVRILRDAGGKFQHYTASRVNSPLHTAVDLNSYEAVEEILDSGANPTVWNANGLTAMHECVKNRNKDILQLIANYEFGNEDPLIAVVDAKDRWGYTVLSAAIKGGWTQGVCIALGAGASVTMKANNGETPLHLAASYGNLDILQEVLIVSKFNSSLDFLNDKGETALFAAIRHDQIDVVKMLLSAGARIEEETARKVNIFHVAAQHGNYEILEHLLEYDNHVTSKMINEPDVTSYTPLVHAVWNNHPKCVELLISKGAEVQVEVHISETNITSPLHIAASKNHFEISEIIINNDIRTIHNVNTLGSMPLHEACCHGNRNIVSLLLQRGADLSGHTGKSKLPPINALMNNISKPTEFIKEIFDTCISSNGRNIQESNCEVTVDYRILVPDESDWKQMRVIKGILNTGNRHDQNTLLLHPLVQSFLYLKWKSLLPYFYTILVMHACFVLALNVYAVCIFFYKDKKRMVPWYFNSSIWRYILYVAIFFIAVQEIIFIKFYFHSDFFYLVSPFAS
ncbi:ankyrin-1-like [Trichoplusia ni]|uniref:Ankyrin-1-like n=1 Tax=Trichoplusia ni TaxID=7111 RepID=A0A7E5VHQ0_TRINI|nr:ankyrin-1-like [Trichoplusia ni]